MKKYFVFSDIHGVYKAWMQALEKAGFDPKNPDHILINLGDSFDRGKDNDLVLEELLSYFKKGRLISIMGNHDTFVVDFLTDGSSVPFNILYNGFGSTLSDWSDSNANQLMYFPELIDPVRKIVLEKYPELIDYLKSMVSIVRLKNYSMTHAGWSLPKQFVKLIDSSKKESWYVNNWAITPDFVRSYPDDGLVHIFGHWAGWKLHDQFNKGNSDPKKGIIFKSQDGRFIGLDAWSNLSNKINVFVIESDEDPITIIDENMQEVLNSI